MTLLFIAVWFLGGFSAAPFLIDQLREDGTLKEYPLSTLAKPEGFITMLGALLGWITLFTVLHTYFSKLWYERRRRSQVRKLKNMRDEFYSVIDKVSETDPDLAKRTKEAFDNTLKLFEDEDNTRKPDTKDA